MKNILKLEEAAMFAFSANALSLFHVHWWVYLLLLSRPDISMFGYFVNNTAGAVCYNLFYHKGIAVAFFAAGLILNDQLTEITGIILFGHSSMDRMLGYGLKLNKGFKYTHLGMIGREIKNN